MVVLVYDLRKSEKTHRSNAFTSNRATSSASFLISLLTLLIPGFLDPCSTRGAHYSPLRNSSLERDRDLKLCTKIDIYKIYRLVAFWKQNGCQWRHHDVIIAQKQQQLVFNHFFLLETQFHRIFSLQNIELRPKVSFYTFFCFLITYF